MKAIKLGDNINTDDIIPVNRISSFDKEELGKFAFEYLVKRENLKGVKIIKAGKNFGCGSSREHAPVALLGAGIKEVIAESFAEIFYRNAINIGLKVKIKDKEKVPSILKDIISLGGLTNFNKKRLNGEKKIEKNKTKKRPMTMVEKLLAKASGNDYVKPGEIVFAKVDLVMSHDVIVLPSTKLFYRNYGRGAIIKNPEKIIFVGDHFIQRNDIRKDQYAKILYDGMINFARKNGIKVYEKINENEAQGICHILLPEKGHIKPGQMIVGTDSHTCTYGAFGAFSTGIGATDFANVLATGDIWIQVPETYKIILRGRINNGVMAKDIILFILKDLGEDGAMGKVIEFSGQVIKNLSIDERMTLSNMAIEAGAICGLIEADKKTISYHQDKVNDGFDCIFPDRDAKYGLINEYDISDLVPQVAKPYSPALVEDVRSLEKIRINKAYIGGCTGGKLTDLESATTILNGKKVFEGVKLYIVPGTQEIKKQAEKLGYLDIFKKAGAIILPIGCGACINAGKGYLKENEVGIFATNRNFRGRNGHPTSKVYLASPRTVAISAVVGYISDSF